MPLISASRNAALYDTFLAWTGTYRAHQELSGAQPCRSTIVAAEMTYCPSRWSSL